MTNTPNDSQNAGLTCPITGCPVKHILLTTAVVFAITFGFDFIFHGTFMKPLYEATSNLWRTEEAMRALFSVSLIYYAVLSVGVASLYCWMGKSASCGGKCPVTGVKFGLLLGLILGITDFSSYAWLPMPDMQIPLHWLAGRLLWGAIIGLALTYSCRLVKKDCCA